MKLPEWLTAPSVLTTVASLAAAGLVLSPFLAQTFGDSGSFRYLHLGLGAVLIWASRRGAAPPSRPSLLALRLASLFFCLHVCWTRFAGFSINGIDFSIFDWQIASTARGQFGYSPIYEVNHFGVHPTFLLLALVPLHALAPSPLWLLALGALSVWAGVFPLRRVLRAVMGSTQDPAFELLLMLAWLDNAWLGRLLNVGFRIESLTPVLLLWFLAGWLERRRWLVVASTLAVLCVKEDVALILPAFAMVSAFRERGFRPLAASVTLLCGGWLWLYLAKVQPALASASPTYLSFWADFGDSPRAIVLGALGRPLRFAQLMLTSGWWQVALPSLFLPFLSVRALAGMAPTLVMLGASSYPGMHDFGTYYPVALVPFIMLGLVDARAKGGRWASAALLAAFLTPLFWAGYARSVGPRSDLERALKREVTNATSAPHLVVQTILFPHVGYGQNLRPLSTHEALRGSAGDVFLLVPALDNEPFEFGAIGAFAARLAACGTRVTDPSGLETITLTRPCDAR